MLALSPRLWGSGQTAAINKVNGTAVSICEPDGGPERHGVHVNRYCTASVSCTVRMTPCVAPPGVNVPVTVSV